MRFRCSRYGARYAQAHVISPHDVHTCVHVSFSDTDAKEDLRMNLYVIEVMYFVTVPKCP